MKKQLIIGSVVLLILSGCSNTIGGEEKVVQEGEENKTSVLPFYRISNEFYQTLLPYETGESKGMILNQLRTRYDMDEFEIGLIRIAQDTFSPNKYIFQEGQYIDRATIRKWLQRKYTAEQVQELGIYEIDNIGLNPIDDGIGTVEERNQKSPIYVTHILEHNYLIRGEGNSVKLGGVVIGIALNSIHYYQKERYGATLEVEIPQSVLEEEGKKLAKEVIQRVRRTSGLQEIPITIVLFRQQSKNSIVPGNFIFMSEIAENSTKMGEWKRINESYLLFPSSTASSSKPNDASLFTSFKADVEKYFTGIDGFIGRGFYVDGNLKELKIEIPIQFFGKAEIISLTQYIAGTLGDYFPTNISIEIQIYSTDGQESLIVRNNNSSEPFVYIYQ